MNSEKTDQASKKSTFFSLSGGVAFGGILILLSATGVLSPFGISYTCPGLGTATSLSQHLKIQDDLSVLVSKEVTIDSNYILSGMTFDIGLRVDGASKDSENPDPALIREVLKVEHSDGDDYYLDGTLVKTGTGPEDERRNRFRKGHNEFKIRYLAHNEISIQDNTAELVWDITSDRHTVAGERISFSLALPESIAASDAEVLVYRRSVSSCDEDFSSIANLKRSNTGNKLLLTADTLNEREMLRAHISWPVPGEPEEAT